MMPQSWSYFFAPVFFAFDLLPPIVAFDFALAFQRREGHLVHVDIHPCDRAQIDMSQLPARVFFERCERSVQSRDLESDTGCEQAHALVTDHVAGHQDRHIRFDPRFATKEMHDRFLVKGNAKSCPEITQHPYEQIVQLCHPGDGGVPMGRLDTKFDAIGEQPMCIDEFMLHVPGPNIDQLAVSSKNRPISL